LNEGEHFYFDIEGCTVVQADIVLGVVDEIQRLTDTDYLVIHTDEALVKEGLPKSFLLPYIDRYILNTDTEEKKIYTRDARDILEAS
jgi:16S rRNA processing protein RimM